LRSFLLSLLKVSLLSSPVTVAASGIAERPVNTTLLISELPAAIPGEHGLQPFWESDSPLLPGSVLVLPDGRLLGADGLGVWELRTGEDAALLFEVPHPVRGLGSFGRHLVVSHFQSGTPAATLHIQLYSEDGDGHWTPGSDLSIPVPGDVLSAGSIALDRSGHLYVTIGDSAAVSAAQDRNSPAGKLLRWRLTDEGTPEPSPADIFASDATVGLFALGFRDAAVSIDSLMGSIYVTDSIPGIGVELNRVAAGGNYGWPIMAGRFCHPPGSTCNPAGLLRPIHVQTGDPTQPASPAMVATGLEAPDLHGLCIMLSAEQGKLVAVRDNGFASAVAYPLLPDNELTHRTVAVDGDGNILLVGEGGAIFRIEAPPGTRNSFPTRLSALPALYRAGSGLDQTDDGIIPYAPTAQLWSDGAWKERFFALPGLEQIGWRAQDGWDFPNRTAIIKNFSLPLDDRNPGGSLQRIETRLMLRLNDQWHGFSYRWNEEETDALLLPRDQRREFEITQSDGTVLAYAWHYPSRTECFRCHTDSANNVLGLNTGQMNGDFTYPASAIRANQLQTLNTISLFDPPLPAAPENLERIPDHRDVNWPLQDRARAYLHANCSHCHRPGGGGQLGTDFRWEIPNGEMGLIWERPTGFDLELEDPLLILPGHPHRSVLFGRMETLTPAYRMPPLGTSRVDGEALQLISEWIATLPVGKLWIVE
jgi:uncharacterized repeat protein (TIGR03806 family)